MKDAGDLVRITEEPHVILVDMSSDEIRFGQEQLLQVLSQIEDLDTEKKVMLSEYTSRGKKLKETYDELTGQLRSRKIMRSVMCRLTLNWTKLTADLHNKETGELIQSRAMTQEERNSSMTPDLPFGEEEAQEPEETVVAGEGAPEHEVVNEGVPDNTPATIDDANQHAAEKFGPDPTQTKASESTPDAQPPEGQTQEPAGSVTQGNDDAQADQDLEDWMGLAGDL